MENLLNTENIEQATTTEMLENVNENCSKTHDDIVFDVDNKCNCSEKKLSLNRKYTLFITIAILVFVLIKGLDGGNNTKFPNGSLSDLNSKYLVSYISDRTISVEDYSDAFKKKLKGTNDSIANAVKRIAQLKTETMIITKESLQFDDIRIIDADGEGRYIVALLVKKSAFHDAYLARVDLDSKTRMYRSWVKRHGELGVYGGLQEIYENYVDDTWGTKLNIDRE